jgi:serine protease Do
MKKRLMGLSGLMVIVGGCSTAPHLVEKANERVISSEASTIGWVKSVRQNVYEVVIPKFEDTDISCEKTLPLEKLTYRERNDKFVSLGTAFSIEANKFISAAHVFNLQTKSLNKNFYVRDIEGNVYKVNQIRRYSLSHDVIEFDLESPSKFETVLKVGQNPEMGDSVYTVGNAQGEGISVRGGQIASFTPEQQDGRWNYLRFSAPASPGNSGGPLLNKNGEVVGIVTMKNASENLNYALPIHEALKLPTDQALFQLKSIPMSIWEKTTSGNLDFSLPLPAGITQFSETAETRMKIFFKNLTNTFVGEHEKSFFPYPESSQAYLRNQTYVWQPHSIDSNGAGGWHVKNINYKSISLGNDRTIYAGGTEQSPNFVIPKPLDVSLHDFFNHPGLVMDVILASFPVQRPIGDEKVRMLSFGKPHEAILMYDKLARPWAIGIWRHNYSFKSTIQACTPIPSGVACNLAEIPTANEVIGTVDMFMEFAHFGSLSYTGNFKQWQEFLSLDKTFLPDPFKTSSLRFLSGKELSYKFGKISNVLYPGNVFNPDSTLSVNMGLTIALPLKQEIHGVTLKPRSDKVTKLHTSTMFKPSKDMNLDLQKRWSDMVERKEPFNGRAFNRDNARMVMYPKAPNDRAVAAEFNGDRIYLSVCTTELTSSESAVGEMCTNYLKNLKLNP